MKIRAKTVLKVIIIIVGALLSLALLDLLLFKTFGYYMFAYK
jgi:hypothetical protein